MARPSQMSGTFSSIAKLKGLPITPFRAPPSEKARLKPKLTHTSVAMPIITKLIAIVLSTFRA